MASGSFSSGEQYSCYAYITWSSSAGTGGSTVTANLYFKARYYYNFTFRNGYALGINNNNITGNGVRVTSAGDWHLLSHSVWVGYTGNCSVGISGYANCTTVTNVSTGNKLPVYNVGGVAALDKVGSVPSTPTMSAPTNSTISETTKTITVSWSKSSSYNGSGNYRVDVSINGGSWNWVSGDINIGTTSWTYTIPNKTQGTTYAFRVSCGNDVGWSSHSYSGTATINKLTCGTMSVQSVFNPYTATTSGSNTVLPVSFTKGSQSLSGTLYYKAQLYCENKLVSSTIFASSANGTSLNILLPAATYLNALGTTSYSKSFVVKAWLENQNGTKSSIIQSSFTVNINTDGGATPTIGSISFSGGALSNPATCFIEHVSSITIATNNITLRRNLSGTTYKTTIKSGHNETKEGSSSATFECWQSGTFTCEVTVTDSRGLSTTLTKQYVVQSYTYPRVTITASGRKTSPNTSATITYKMYYSPIYQYTTPSTRGNQLNSISVQQYSKNSGTWTTYTSGKDITGLDTNYSYNFAIRVADKVVTSYYAKDTCTIPTIKSLLSIRSWGVGIGCIPQTGHGLEVTGVAQFNNGVTSNDLIQIRGGSSAANKRLLDFGWSGQTAKHSIILNGSGSLKFTAYSNGSGEDAMLITQTGDVTIDELHSKNIDNVNGTIRTNYITDADPNKVIKVGLLAASEQREWIGMYDINSTGTRYFWMGRNKDANKKFYFSGESSIEKFVFNKPIYFPTSSKMVDGSGAAVVTFSTANNNSKDFVVSKSIISNGDLFTNGNTNNKAMITYNNTIRSMQWSGDDRSYIHINTSSGAYGVNVWASDYRLKENIEEIYTPALDIISKIRHVEFDWKVGEGHVGFGYVADELQNLYPELVFEVGEEKRKHINHTILIPVISKAIQEQQREIECCYDNMGDLVREVLDLKSELENLKSNKEE